MISIIIPVYNAEKYLRECVNSILTQTYQNVEIILVDDGSVDKSGEICDECAHQDKRIKVVHQHNSGAHQARMNGLSIATGEWAAFVDSDDYLPSNALECLLSVSDGYDMVSGRIVMVNNETGEHINYYSHKSKEDGVFSGREIIHGILHHNYAPNITRRIAKTEILRQAVISIPRDIVLGEDMIYCISTCFHVNKVRGIPDIVYYYRLQPSRTTNTHHFKLEDIDNFDVELEKLLGNQAEFKEGLFRNRMTETIRHIDKPGFCQSRIRNKVMESYSLYPLSMTDRFLIFLCRINSHDVRKTMFWLFKKLIVLKNKKFRGSATD